MFEEVRTARLVGTKPLLRDADELHPVCADPRVAEWIWPEGPPTLARVRALLVQDAAHWKRHRFGVWVLRCDGAVVGRAGLHTEGDEVALDWLLAPERWGRGLATEIVRAALDHAFGALALESVIAETLVGNERSRALMERCGMVHEADVERAGLPHVRYRLAKAAS